MNLRGAVSAALAALLPLASHAAQPTTTAVEPVWNNLEIAKLVVAALTPIAVALLALWLNRHLKRFEHLQWASQKVIEKRLAIYSTLAPVLNDLYCYFDYIGEWKFKDPSAAIDLKRDADRQFFVNAPLFSSDFQRAYQDFIDLCFIPGPLDEYDASATLRTDIDVRKDIFKKRGKPWSSQWDAYFAPQGDVTDRAELVRGYRRMMDAFARDLGVGLRERKTNTQ